MNIYELMFILNPDLSGDDQEAFTTRFKSLISKNGGEVIRFEDLGIKNLAYRINKKPRGHYFLSYFEGPGPLVAELERNLRMNENVMRFISVKMEDHITREAFEKIEESQETAAETPAEEEK